jgi:hypothetical protein
VYRLRLTKFVGPNYNGEIIDDGACRIYSASQIVSEQGAFPMFARTQARVYALQAAEPHNVFGGDAAYDSGFVWGWLKSPTTETETGRYRIKLATEWTLAWWHASLLYQVA